MTVSALTRPGERDRVVNKFGEIDWIFCLTLCLIAGAGSVMLFSIAGSSWNMRVMRRARISTAAMRAAASICSHAVGT